MGKKLVSRTAKVLSETKKTKDKEAVAIAYEHIPRNPAEQQHGSIYAVIELEDKSGHAEEIAERIIDVLYEHYYEDTDKDALTALEGALAKINDELTERSSEGQIDWLGKLNAVLAVLCDNTLHVTQTGKAEAYLYRGEHAMHITDGLAGDAINPQRTFINIASGDLAEKDRVALVTPGVFFKVSKSELKKFATESSPKMAAEDLSHLLAGENGTAKPNAILLMEMLSPESFISDETADEQTEVWVKDEKNTVEEIGTGMAGGTVKVFDYLGKAYAGAATFITTKALPNIKKNVSKAKDGYDNFKKERDAENVIIESEEKISHLKEKDIDLEIDTDDGILETPLETSTGKTIRIKETHRKPKLLSLERFDFSFVERAKSNFSDRKGRKSGFRLPKGRLSFIYLGIAVALVVGLLAYLNFGGATPKTNTDLQNKYSQAQSLYDQSQTSIGSGDFATASSQLESAEKLANEVLIAGYQTSETQALLEKIKSSMDSASRTTRNSATVAHEFENPVTQILSDGKLIYGVNFENGAIYSYDPVASTSATIAESSSLGGKIKLATLVASRNTLVAYTDASEIYEIDMKNGKATKQTVSGTLEKVAAMDFFGTNIYNLSTADNQVFKHFNTSAGYGKGTNYFPEAPDLSKIVDIAIDGALYTTDATAEVNKYTSGERDSYALTDLPKKYTDIKGIYTSVDTEGIYLFAKELVIKIDKKGKFVAQYAQDGATNISSVFVGEDAKIYFLSDNKLYKI